MSDRIKQFYIVAGKPILKPRLLQETDGDYDTLAKEGQASVPLLEKELMTALGRYKCKYEIGPPKSQARYNVKSIERGYESPRNNTDFCRAFIYVTDVKQLIKLTNFFRPSNNSKVLLFEDTFAVPKLETDLRRVQIKIRLPNGHIAEIQIRHAKMKHAFEASHEAYEKVASATKRFPNPETRPLEVQKTIEHYGRKRYDANHNAALKLPSLQKLIHKRSFFRVNDTPVMLVEEPFTGESYTVIPKMTKEGPMFVIDNSFMSSLKDKEITQTSNREAFISASVIFAKASIQQPAFEVVA